MKSCTFGFTAFLLLLMLWLNAESANTKPTPSLRPLASSISKPLYPKSYSSSLVISDTCVAYEGTDPAWAIYPWVVGDELYKAYQDPAAACASPYPFAIHEVHTILYIAGPVLLYLSADIETVNMTDPSCPHPGNILTLTPIYEISVPSEDLFLITLPLDSPVVVNGPYFVGLYYGPDGGPQNVALVTDDTPVPCVSYNDWGEGYVDLDTVYTDPDGTGPIKTFPGRLILFSSGIAGGGQQQEPPPSAEIILPRPNQLTGFPVRLWINDTSGSNIIERAEFSYFATNVWQYIGADQSDDPVLRNGVAPSNDGDGLSFLWNGSLPENNYLLRGIVTDTLGRADTAEITVCIDPTPLIPMYTQPALGDDICGGIYVRLTCPDEDLSYMSFARKEIPLTTSLPIPIIQQTLGGDINGNPFDGNTLAAGEFGPYCSGPAATAMAVKYWGTKGYSLVLREGTSTLTDAQLIDRLFQNMRIEDNFGCYDEEFVSGLEQYLLTHGGGFTISLDRQPNIATLYRRLLDEECAVMVGLSGNPGFWMTAAGASGVGTVDDQHTFRFADPITGQILNYAVREQSGIAEVYANFQWMTIDLAVGLIPVNWTITRPSVGFDGNGGDGWGFFWNTDNLSRENLHFIQASAYDGSGNQGEAVLLLKNDCSAAIVPGDVNGDGLVNPGDLIFLINFVYMESAPPPKGDEAANINGDNLIDLSDVMYLYRYLFLGGPAPQ